MQAYIIIIAYLYRGDVMNFTEKLIALINHHNGIVVTKHVTEAGIPRIYRSELVKKVY